MRRVGWSPGGCRIVARPGGQPAAASPGQLQATKGAARPVAMLLTAAGQANAAGSAPWAMKITNSGGVDPGDYRPARRRPRRRSAVRRSVTVTRYLLGVLAAPVVMAASAARRR